MISLRERLGSTIERFRKKPSRPFYAERTISATQEQSKEEFFKFISQAQESVAVVAGPMDSLDLYFASLEALAVWEGLLRRGVKLKVNFMKPEKSTEENPPHVQKWKDLNDKYPFLVLKLFEKSIGYYSAIVDQKEMTVFSEVMRGSLRRTSYSNKPKDVKTEMQRQSIISGDFGWYFVK